MLPPIGHITDENQAEAINYLSLIVEESAEEHRKPLALADESTYIYGYGRAEDDPTEPFVNEIQNAVITATDVQTKDPIQVTLEPVETGEPPATYWAGPEQAAYALGLTPEFVTGFVDETGQPQPPLPLDPQFAEQLRARAVPKELMPALPPMLRDGGPAIRPDWLVDVDDRTVADTYQSVFDVHWMRCDADFFIADNLLDNNVQGWSYALYQFNDDDQKHVLKHLPIRQVHIDPLARDISDAAYAGFDLPMDADEAKRQFPHLTKDIEDNATDGTPALIDGGLGRWGAAYDRNFRRKMIVFRVMWLRNQPLPLEKDEAVAIGILEERAVPDVSVDEQAQAGAVPFVPNAPDDLPGVESPGGEPGGPEPVGGDDSARTGDGDPDTGLLGVPSPAGGEPDDGGEGVALPELNPLGDPGDGASLDDIEQTLSGESVGADETLSEQIILPSRMACFLTGTDTEVTPDSVMWPHRLTLRQVTQVANRIVDDRESEFSDIPIWHNQNIPMTGSRPWGMGEPYRLKNAQAALNRTITAMVDNADWFAHPMTVMSQFTYQQLPEEYKDARAVPGISLVIPDDVYRQTGGKVDTIVTPPAMNESHTFLAPYLQDLIQKESGNTEVLQGRANPQIKSGVAINLLQSAATSLIGFKSKRTGRMVRYGAKLMLHALKTRLTTEDLYQIVSQYPPHVLDAIRERAQKIEWNVMVQVESATGGMQMQKRQNAQLDLKAGAISMQTYREQCGLDDRVEKQRIEAQQQEAARMQSMFAPAASTGEEEGESKQPPPQQ